MVNVRKATIADVSAISQLLKRKYSFPSLDEARSVFEKELPAQHFRIAERDGQPIGIVGWRPQGTYRHGVVELTRIAVAPEVADPLIVKEYLFDVMVAEADYAYKQHRSRLRKVFSMIHADNRHVREFFMTKGMQQEAVLKNHFHPGQDELVFSLFLV